MEPLIIQGTEDTPKIQFDPDKGMLIFSGKSLPEDTHIFFNELKIWIVEYMKAPKLPTTLEFKLKYFNTATSKIFIDLLITFVEELGPENVIVNWYYSNDDDEMQEIGEDLSETTDIPFNYYSY